jgi:hypothetical protein
MKMKLYSLCLLVTVAFGKKTEAQKDSCMYSVISKGMAMVFIMHSVKMDCTGKNMQVKKVLQPEVGNLIFMKSCLGGGQSLPGIF